MDTIIINIINIIIAGIIIILLKNGETYKSIKLLIINDKAFIRNLLNLLKEFSISNIKYAEILESENKLLVNLDVDMPSSTKEGTGYLQDICDRELLKILEYLSQRMSIFSSYEEIRLNLNITLVSVINEDIIGKEIVVSWVETQDIIELEEINRRALKECITSLGMFMR